MVEYVDPDWFEPSDVVKHLGHAFDPDVEPVGHLLASEHQAPDVVAELPLCQCGHPKIEHVANTGVCRALCGCRKFGSDQEEPRESR